MSRLRSCTWRGPAGQTLLVVLTIMLAVTVSAGSFIWYMNRQQARAGLRYRTVAALSLAQAGVRRALAVFEGTAPDGSPGRLWRPVGYEEVVAAGSLGGGFRLTVTPERDGAVVVTSDGTAGGVTRRLRARVYLASPALLAGVSAAGSVQVGAPSGAVTIVAYAAPADRPWVHIAAATEVWFFTADFPLNDAAAALPAGPVDLLPGASAGAGAADPVQLLLGAEASLALGGDRRPVDPSALRAAGLRVEDPWRPDPFPAIPGVDQDFYRDLAAANSANAEINRQAGELANDPDLRKKPDSFYDAEQFARVVRFLASRTDPPELRGILYVAGRVTIPPDVDLRLADGALVAGNTVKLEEGARFTVSHTAGTRRLPAVLVLGTGGLVLSAHAELLAHGLVYAAQTIEVTPDAGLRVVGAVASNDPGISVRVRGALTVRYDPAVLGTPGLRVAGRAPVTAWAAEWQEEMVQR